MKLGAKTLGRAACGLVAFVAVNSFAGNTSGSKDPWTDPHNDWNQNRVELSPYAPLTRPDQKQDADTLLSIKIRGDVSPLQGYSGSNEKFYSVMNPNSPEKILSSSGKVKFLFYGTVSPTQFKTMDDFLTGTPEQVMKNGRSLGLRDPFANLSLDEVAAVRAYVQALKAKNAQGFFQNLNDIKDTMPTPESKLIFIQTIGKQLNARFDQARNDRGLRALTNDTPVDYDQLYQSLTDAKVSSGVCRDAASFLGHALDSLGFHRPYVIGYVPDHGLYHATIVATDAQNRQKIYKIDYARVTTSVGTSGGAALYQGTTDAALNYYIFEPGGKMVGNTPSEMRKFLVDVTGADIRRLDPLAKSNHSVAEGTLQLDDDGDANARFFIGQDLAPSQYVGAAIDYRYGKNTLVPGHVSLVFASQMRPGGFQQDSTSHEIIYADLDQRFLTPSLEDENKKTRAWLEGYFNLGAAGIYTATGPNQGAWGEQGDLRFGAEAKLDRKLWDDGSHVEVTAGTQFSPGLNDVRDLHSANVTLNFVYLSAQTILRLKEDPSLGPISLALGGTGVWSAIGPRGRIDTGLLLDKYGFFVSYGGKFSADTPNYEEGSDRLVGMSFYYLFSPKLKLSAFVFLPTEHTDDTSGGFMFLYDY